MNRTMTIAVSAVALASFVLVGCGSSSSSDGAKDDVAVTTAKAAETTTVPAKAAPTTAEFCANAKAAFGDYQPGFDAIFEQHPKPTLADWAAFLPKPTQEFDNVIAAIEKVQPSDEAADDYDAALAAMKTVSQNFHDGIAAAEAGDQAAYDAAEAKNQGTGDTPGDTATMKTALDKMTAYCGGGSN